MYVYASNITYLTDYDNSDGKEDIKEIQDYRENLYKMDILKAFGAKDYNDNINSLITNVITQELLPLYINNEHIVALIELSKKMWITEDNQHGFLGLFAYDYFYYLHRILQCVHNNEKLDANYDLLYNKLK